MLVSRLFFLMTCGGSESGCLGSENHAFGIRGIAKNNFLTSWNSHDCKVIFYDFGFVAMEARLRFDDFSRLPCGTTKSWQYARRTVNWFIPRS